MSETSTLILKLESAKYNKQLDKSISKTLELEKASKKVGSATSSSAKTASESSSKLGVSQIALGSILGNNINTINKFGGAWQNVQTGIVRSLMTSKMFGKSILDLHKKGISLGGGGLTDLTMGQSFKHGGIKGLGLNVFAKGFDKVDTAMTHVIGNIGKYLIAGAALVLMTKKMITTIVKFIKVSNIQEDAEASVAAIFKITKNASRLTAEAVKEYAARIQNATGAADELILANSSILGSFIEIKGPIFKGAMKAMVDLSVLMRTDMKSAAMQLGKALNDPAAGLSALTRSGVSFSQKQKDTIKSLTSQNKIFEAQSLMLKVINEQAGEFARIMGNTTSGKMKKLNSEWGDMQEHVGSIVKNLIGLPYLIDKMTNSLKKTNKELKEFRQGSKVTSKREKAMDIAAAVVRFASFGLINLPNQAKTKLALYKMAGIDPKTGKPRALGVGGKAFIPGAGAAVKDASNTPSNFVGGARAGSVSAARTAGQTAMKFQAQIANATQRTAEALERIERKYGMGSAQGLTGQPILGGL